MFVCFFFKAKVNPSQDEAGMSTATGLQRGIKLRPCQVFFKFHPKLTDWRKRWWDLALSITVLSISVIEASVCRKIRTLAFQGVKYYYSHFTNEESSSDLSSRDLPIRQTRTELKTLPIASPSGVLLPARQWEAFRIAPPKGSCNLHLFWSC